MIKELKDLSKQAKMSWFLNVFFIPHLLSGVWFRALTS